ncbi:integrase, catalytic region, zinc finger, CCHC-type containing protein [Tanacetum coccineum]
MSKILKPICIGNLESLPHEMVKHLNLYYLRFYKIMNELVRNKCEVTNHQVNVQFLLTLTTRNGRSKIIAERLARTANPLSLVAQQQPVYHSQPHPTQYTQNSSTRSQQDATRNKGIWACSKRMSETKWAKDATYYKEKMLLCKQEEAGIRLIAKQVDWRDDTDDEPKDQELEANYLYMAKIQEVTPDAADNYGPVFDAEPLQKVQNDDDVLARERKQQCQLEDYKNKNKCLESSNNHFKEANTKLAKNNQLMFKDLKKFQAKLDRYHDVNYALKVKIECAKAKGELISHKMSFEKSFDEYTQKINDLNQMISKMKKELIAHQESISIMSQKKEAQKKFHKAREDKELEKVIALENKIKALDDIFLKKAQTTNPHLYDIGCYNDNLALMLASESDETIRLAQESRSKLMLKRSHAKKTWHGYIDPVISSTIETNFDPSVHKLMINTEKKIQSLKEEIVVDLKYFNSLENEIKSLQSQLETQRTQFLNEIDRISREYYYAGHMNEILSAYTKLDEVTNLQCDYLEALEKCQSLENELSKRNTTSISFEALQQHAINLEIALQQYLKARLQDKNIAISALKKLIDKMKGKCVETKFDKSSVIRQPNAFKCKKQSILGVIPTTSVSRPQLKSNRLEDRVLHNNSQGKNQELVEIILFIIDSWCSKHMTGNLKLLVNFMEKFLGTVKFGNEQIAPILVAFRKSTCYIRDLKGNDLLTGSRASSSQAWLWHHRLSHLNFDTINFLSKYDIVTSLPKLKFVKDHLCSSCELGKAKRYSTISRAYRVYNKRTRLIVETIHVNIDELPQMASDHVNETVTTSNDLDLLFSLMFDELLNGTTPVVSKSSAIHAADAHDQR